MKIYAVKLDTHDYDFMSEWFLDDAYLTEDDAKAGAEQAKAKFYEDCKKNGQPISKKQKEYYPNVEIIELDLKLKEE